jgi:MFS superfamily sulfate permease-like transporter
MTAGNWMAVDAVVPAKTASRWSDLIAGLCVAGLLLPEAVAYAGLAHLPVAHAFTAVLVGLALYATFGGSRFAIVSPTSSTATLVAAAAVSVSGNLASPYGDGYLQAVLALVLLCGGMLVVLGLAQQGQLSSFISRPVLKGFAFALAISIVIKQLPDALGFHLRPELASDPAHVLAFTVAHVELWHGASVAIAAAAALLIALLHRKPQIPASMLVIVLAIAAASFWNLKAYGVEEVGTVQPVALHWGFPDLTTQQWMRAGELAFGLVMLVFAESWGSMRSMALVHGDSLDANRELLVLGACNSAAAVLQGMPVGAGFSATSANAAAGAVSRKAGAIALAAVLAALVFALPALPLLPRPVLAVAVISALWHALSPKPILALWRMNRDRVLLVSAALAVLFLGVLHGMLAAVGLSIVIALNRFSRPVVHELGELGSTRNFVDIHVQQGALAIPGMLIVRPEEPLFFASAERVTAEIGKLLRARSGIATVILSLEESGDLDSTAVDCLTELDQQLQSAGIVLYIARAKTTVRTLLANWAPQGLGQEQRMFWSVADAVEYALQH